MINSRVPPEIKNEIKKIVFSEADKFCYVEHTKADNSKFMNNLLDDARIGGKLKEYMNESKARVYIKDCLLHKYTDSLKNSCLRQHDPIKLIKDLFEVDAHIITTKENIILCSTESQIEKFIICNGTVVRWENALRKALEFIARYKNDFTISPKIILQLVEYKNDMTEADHLLIINALKFIEVEVVFRNKLS
ncbi:MAG: hypothetical protein LBU04_06725 [Christensenellaceae bacterium]|jgi:hypothetical protein|nr:hypothetical protein [Christensenellaceae bacterium]